jgi:hypothetical protein
MLSDVPDTSASRSEPSKSWSGLGCKGAQPFDVARHPHSFLSERSFEGMCNAITAPQVRPLPRIE